MLATMTQFVILVFRIMPKQTLQIKRWQNTWCLLFFFTCLKSILWYFKQHNYFQFSKQCVILHFGFWSSCLDLPPSTKCTFSISLVSPLLIHHVGIHKDFMCSQKSLWPQLTLYACVSFLENAFNFIFSKKFLLLKNI